MHKTNKQRGLTLIEVLIALAIVSIAMTAVIKATSQNIRATNHLQNKTMAMWVAKLIINEARVEVLRFPSPQNKMEQSTHLLGRTWFWRAEKKETPNPRIKKIEVTVFASEKEREEVSPLASVESYVYQIRKR